MKRVLVLGGRGFVGGRVVAALSKVEGIEVDAGGRRGPVVVDLFDSTSLAALDAYDAVVNCADAIAAPPDAAIERVLAQCGVFVETTAHTATLDRLLRETPAEGKPGALVLGAGAFPGLSNLLAAEVAAACGECTQLDVGVRFSPLGGAGPGTCSLMVELSAQPSPSFADGQRRDLRPISAGPPLTFGSTRRGTVRVAFAEPLLLAHSLGVPNLGAFLAPVPGFARPLALLAGLLPTFLVANPLSRFVGKLALRLVRSVLLCWKQVPVELTAVGRASDGREVVRSLSLPDGMLATAHAIAATTAKLLEHGPPRAGLLTVDQAIDLQECCARMAELGCTLAFPPRGLATTSP